MLPSRDIGGAWFHCFRLVKHAKIWPIKVHRGGQHCQCKQQIRCCGQRQQQAPCLQMAILFCIVLQSVGSIFLLIHFCHLSSIFLYATAFSMDWNNGTLFLFPPFIHYFIMCSLPSILFSFCFWLLYQVIHSFILEHLFVCNSFFDGFKESHLFCLYQFKDLIDGILLSNRFNELNQSHDSFYH